MNSPHLERCQRTDDQRGSKAVNSLIHLRQQITQLAKKAKSQHRRKRLAELTAKNRDVTLRLLKLENRKRSAA